MTVAENYLADAIGSFRSYKRLAERAIKQLDDDQYFYQIDAESNSVAVIVKHIAGNLHSRWREFLTTDGEKPDRHRDTEFEIIGDSRESLMAFWEAGWQTLFEALESLSPDDLNKTVMIRGQSHTVVEAINRQLTHYSYHIGQIVFLAKHLRSSEWTTLSVPRNRSAAFNEYLAEKLANGETIGHRLDATEHFANTLTQDEKGETA